MNRFYVYKLINPDNNSLLYIGKGTNKRRFDFKLRNNHLRNKLNKILEKYNKEDISVIIEDNLTSEHAYKLEIELIAKYNPCYNICRGGEGIDPDLVKGEKNVNYKQIDKSEYIKLLSDGKSNGEAASELGVSQNTLKSKFYPKSTLKQFCKDHTIQYYNTQSGNKNGNYKKFPKERFVELIKKGAGLTLLEKELGLSKRCLIVKYREEFNVSNWKDLLEKI